MLPQLVKGGYFVHIISIFIENIEIFLYHIKNIQTITNMAQSGSASAIKTSRKALQQFLQGNSGFLSDTTKLHDFVKNYATIFHYISKDDVMIHIYNKETVNNRAISINPKGALNVLSDGAVAKILAADGCKKSYTEYKSAGEKAEAICDACEEVEEKTAGEATEILMTVMDAPDAARPIVEAIAKVKTLPLDERPDDAVIDILTETVMGYSASRMSSQVGKMIYEGGLVNGSVQHDARMKHGRVKTSGKSYKTVSVDDYDLITQVTKFKVSASSARSSSKFVLDWDAYDELTKAGKITPWVQLLWNFAVFTLLISHLSISNMEIFGELHRASLFGTFGDVLKCLMLDTKERAVVSMREGLCLTHGFIPNMDKLSAIRSERDFSNRVTMIEYQFATNLEKRFLETDKKSDKPDNWELSRMNIADKFIGFVKSGQVQAFSGLCFIGRPKALIFDSTFKILNVESKQYALPSTAGLKVTDDSAKTDQIKSCVSSIAKGGAPPAPKAVHFHLYD